MVVAVLGVVGMLAGFWLAASEVESGPVKCGSALSPSDLYDPMLSDGENFMNSLGSSGCEEKLASRRWTAAVVVLLGLGAVIVAGRAMNIATPVRSTDGEADPPEG